MQRLIGKRGKLLHHERRRTMHRVNLSARADLPGVAAWADDREAVSWEVRGRDATGRLDPLENRQIMIAVGLLQLEASTVLRSSA
jgi:hypothetical protein